MHMLIRIVHVHFTANFFQITVSFHEVSRAILCIGDLFRGTFGHLGHSRAGGKFKSHPVFINVWPLE